MHMNKSTIRQRNYRRRIRLQHTLISLKIFIEAGQGSISLKQMYIKLLEEWVLLRENKGELNVRKK